MDPVRSRGKPRHAEQAIGENEERYRRLFREVPVGLYVSSLQGDMLELNDAARDMSGVGAGEDLSSLRATTFYADPRERERLLERIQRDGFVDHVEFLLRRRDGTTVWVDESARLIRDASGKPIGIVGTVHDVTARRGAEDAARRRTVELTALVETAVDLLHHLDLDGVLRAIIERATVVVGVSDAFVSLVEPDGRSSVVRYGVGGAHMGLRLGPGEGAVGRAWAERRTIAVNEYPTWPDALPALVADGMLAVATVPLIVQEQVLGVLGVVHRDVGRTFDDDAVAVLERFAHMASLALENARVAAELGEAEQRYRLLVERLPAIAYLDRVDPEPSTIYVSPQVERILGYRPEEWLGSPERWLAAVHPDDRKAAQLVYEDRFRPDRPESHEYRMIARDGRTVWVRDEWETVHDERGEPRFYQGLMYDITERHELEEKLRQAQKMEAVGQLAGGIAHDFNNLLTAMRGYAELLVADLEAEDPRRHDALEIQRAAERASTLTGQLLAFSRRQVLRPRVIELDGALRGMETFLRRLIGEDVEVVVQTDAPGAAVRLDPSQLEQVIVNLAVNARDAMPDGGRLTIATGREKGGDGTEAVVLAVTDTGHGIDAETRVHIFEPFFTTKPHGKGTGLGLATVYGIVEQSGATIDLRTAPGEGTTFEVRFPVLPAIEAGNDLASPVATANDRGTILVAEDEAAVRDLVVSVLTAAGYSVYVASDAPEALSLASDPALHLDLLLTDIVMPGMNGRVLAQRIRALRPGARVLYMSGYPLGAEITETDGRYLQKPFARDDLLDAVRAALSS